MLETFLEQLAVLCPPFRMERLERVDGDRDAFALGDGFDCEASFGLHHFVLLMELAYLVDCVVLKYQVFQAKDKSLLNGAVLQEVQQRDHKRSFASHKEINAVNFLTHLVDGLVLIEDALHKLLTD